jgi:hypothetical protein
VRLIGRRVKFAFQFDRVTHDIEEEVKFTLCASGRRDARYRQRDPCVRTDPDVASVTDAVEQAWRQLRKQPLRVELVVTVKTLIQLVEGRPATIAKQEVQITARASFWASSAGSGIVTTRLSANAPYVERPGPAQLLQPSWLTALPGCGELQKDLICRGFSSSAADRPGAVSECPPRHAFGLVAGRPVRGRRRRGL